MANGEPIRVDKTVLVLLAAGMSQRFGETAKLHEDFLNRPLGIHVAVALQKMPFLERVAIVDAQPLPYGELGYRVIENRAPQQGMASSLHLGVAHAKECGADAVLIALADMPRVTAAHVYRLFDATEGTGLGAVVASSDGHAPKPPALFGRDRFDFLLALEGVTGARDLVRAGRHVVTSPAELIDVDTPADLERLRGLVKSHEAVARAQGRVTG